MHINNFIISNTIIHNLYLYIHHLQFIHYSAVVWYIYCIVAVLYYVNCYCLLVKWHCMKQLKIYYLDTFHIQPLLDGAWIFEMYMTCKCKCKSVDWVMLPLWFCGCSVGLDCLLVCFMIATYNLDHLSAIGSISLVGNKHYIMVQAIRTSYDETISPAYKVYYWCLLVPTLRF